MDERDNDHNKVFETLKNSIERSYQRAAFTGKNIPDKEKKSLIYMHKMREFIDEKFVLLEKGTLKEGTLEYSDAMLELKNRFMDFFVATDEKIYDFIKARELVRNSIYNLYKIIVPKIRPNKDSTDPEEKRLAYLYDAKRFINKTFNRVES
jgi:intergrase/recombinase